MNKQSKININAVMVIAIIALAIMQVAAMHYDVNHTMRTYTVGAIAGLAGWRIPWSKK